MREWSEAGRLTSSGGWWSVDDEGHACRSADDIIAGILDQYDSTQIITLPIGLVGDIDCLLELAVR